MRYGFAIVIVTTGVLAASVCGQDSFEDRLKRLEAENKRILDMLEASQQRNAALEHEVSTLRTEADDLRIEQGSLFESALEKYINGVAELDGSGWSNATKSGLEIRFYGFVRFDAYYNTARATDPVIPFAILPETGLATSSTADENDDQYAFDSRLTRIGIDIRAGEIGSADVTAKIETDFANFTSGSTESRETPRIRLAYINLDFGEVTLRFGQDWDVISPLYPAVHSELLLWGAGNLGDRRPQIQLLWEPETGGSVSFLLELSAGMAGAVDGADNDGIGGRTNVDAFDSGHPHGQLRLALSFDSWVEDKRAVIGVWGLVGELETDTQFNGEDSYVPWVVGLDIKLPLFGPVHFTGEVWYGQALSDVRGNLLQDINTLTGDEIQGWGGWAEIHWQATEKLRLAVGGSIDNPDDDDLQPGVGGENRELNWTVYVSSKYDWGGGLYTGFDVIYWETQWADLGIGNALRFNFWIQLNF